MMADVPSMTQAIMMLLGLSGSLLLGLLVWLASRSLNKLDKLTDTVVLFAEQIKTLFHHIERHEIEIHELRNGSLKRKK